MLRCRLLLLLHWLAAGIATDVDFLCIHCVLRAWQLTCGGYCCRLLLLLHWLAAGSPKLLISLHSLLSVRLTFNLQPLLLLLLLLLLLQAAAAALAGGW
jgi:hypothetical protein